ncbi:MAG TPA: extracellular solute-binding protein, partial [Chloroflexota bacterium]|nr:extracellular solute-binding protein [Chloroflexota bacterium]
MDGIGTAARVATRRRTLGIGGLLSGAALVAACGPQEPSGGSQAGAPGSSNSLGKVKPVSLEFWGDPPQTGSNTRTDQIDFWNNKNPNFKVTFGATKTTGQGVTAVQSILASVAAGNPPDVVDFDRFQTTAFTIKGVWQALDDFMKRDKFEASRFAPLIIPEAKGMDGKWYALIRSTDDRLIFWNKEAFQEAGLDPEKPPATWDELRQFAIRLTKRGGPMGFERIGFHTEEGQSHYHQFAWQSGGSFQTADGKKGTLPLGPNQEALQWMTDLMKDLGGWDTLKTYRDSWGKDAQQSFLVGQLGMVYQTNNYAGTIARFRPDMKFGAAQPPLKKAGDKPLTWSGGFGYNMIKDSKKQDAGWEFMKWLVSEEGISVGHEGDLARNKAAGNTFLPSMSGQPDLDKKFYAKYKTGVAAIDKVPEIAVPLMQYSRVREPSIAAQNLWDAVKA